MSNKKQPYQSRLAFDDVDLKTPKHDEMMLWLDKQCREQLDKFVMPFVPSPEKLQQTIYWQEVASSRELDDAVKAAAGALPDTTTPQLRSITWELPMMNGTFIAGFIDLGVTVDVCTGFHITAKRRYSGMPFEIAGSWQHAFRRHQVLYEVKTAVPSIGELLRQLQFYRKCRSYHEDERIPDRRFVVVAPKNEQVQDVLRTQGVGFLEYPGENH